MTDRPGLPGAGRRPGRAPALAAVALAASVSACSLSPAAPPVASSGSRPAGPPASSSAATPDIPGLPGESGHGTGSASPAGLPLAGKVVGIDPGHNGGNFTNPGAIAHLIWNGTAWEACDTTGTTTDGGYPEAQFTFNVARYLRADLRRDGAGRPGGNGRR